MYDFSVVYDNIDANDILVIHKYFMFGFMKKMFIGLSSLRFGKPSAFDHNLGKSERQTKLYL